MERTLSTVYEGGRFFESPRWNEGQWWASDCAAPDFLEHNRAHARDGVLLRTRVDVPHAGLP